MFSSHKPRGVPVERAVNRINGLRDRSRLANVIQPAHSILNKLIRRRKKKKSLERVQKEKEESSLRLGLRLCNSHGLSLVLVRGNKGIWVGYNGLRGAGVRVRVQG